MNTSKFFVLLSLIFFNFTYVEAKGIPYCSKKIVRGCVQQKEGRTAKYYFAPKYKESKSAVAKVKPKKITKIAKYKKKTKVKRGIASVSPLKLKLKKAKKKKTK